MNLGTLVWRNLVRRPGRFAFTLAGVAVGIAAFVALLTLGQGLTQEIRRQAQGWGRTSSSPRRAGAPTSRSRFSPASSCRKPSR